MSHISAFISHYSQHLLAPSIALPIEIKPTSPRLVSHQAHPSTFTVEPVQQFSHQFCNQSSIGFVTACLGFAQKNKKIEESLNQAEDFILVAPNLKGEPGNAWKLALFIDQFSLYAKPKYSTRIRALKNKLKPMLFTYLSLLNGYSASLWHSRLSLASHAFIIAVVLGDSNPEELYQAHGHFIDGVRALEITEAWPNGYNYWINNRAFPFLLASSAYINGTQGKDKQRLLALLERIGLWHIYMTRPDNRFAAIGDDGPRVDLKDESRKVIDFITYLTKNPIFATYSQYLKHLHGKESYYRRYRWMPSLFYDPTVKAIGEYFDDLRVFNGILPTTAIFGKGAYNQVVMRSGWSKNDGFIQIRAGANFSHHQHYDAGHFTVFYKQPVVVDAAVYSHNYVKPSRLNFSLRSVAKNTLLLPMAGELVNPNHFFKENINPGGQKIIAPTGSAVTSVAEWLNQSDKYKSATLLRQVAVEQVFSFAEFDLTKSYHTSTKKAEQVVRGVLYLPYNQKIMVFDQLSGVQPNVRAKSQLHLMARPDVDSKATKKHNAVHLFDSSKNIALSQSDVSISLLLPKSAISHLYDGEASRFLVESFEATGSIIRNQRAGYRNKKWFDNPQYRIEWQQRIATKEQKFVQVISLEKNKEPPQIVEENINYRLYKLDKTLVIEYITPQKSIFLSNDYNVKHLIIIAPYWIKENTITLKQKAYTVSLEQGVGYIKVAG